MLTIESEIIRHAERLYGPFVHMAPNDKAIWTRYLMNGGNQAAPFLYDHRVGNGITMPAGSGRIAEATAYALTTKRIDALSYRASVWTIYEVKQRAGLTAIGQLIGYRELLREQIQPADFIALVLVTDEAQPDMHRLCDNEMIVLVEVGL